MGLRGRDAPKCQLADECREAGRAARVFRMSPPECPTQGSVQGLCRPGTRERWGPRGPVSALCGAQRAGARARLEGRQESRARQGPRRPGRGGRTFWSRGTGGSWLPALLPPGPAPPRRGHPPLQPASCRPLSFSSRTPIWPLVEQTRMPAGAREVQDAGTPVGPWLGQGSLTRFHECHPDPGPSRASWQKALSIVRWADQGGRVSTQGALYLHSQVTEGAPLARSAPAPT